MQGMKEHCVRADVLVPTDNSNLQLWYPNGYGKPNLYPYEATVNINKVSLSYYYTFQLLLYDRIVHHRQLLWKGK